MMVCMKADRVPEWQENRSALVRGDPQILGSTHTFAPRSASRYLRMRMGFLLCCCAAHHASAILDPTNEEKRMMWKYPNCDHLKTEPYRKVDWLWYRDQLHQLPYPDNVRVTFSVLENLTGSSSAEYDEEARVCLMGVPAAFFYLTKYTLDSVVRDDDGMLDAGMLRSAIMQYSVFENYISVFHPGLIDNANWTITDREAGKLRRDILRASRQLEREEEKSSGRVAPAANEKTADSHQQLRIYVSWPICTSILCLFTLLVRGRLVDLSFASC